MTASEMSKREPDESYCLACQKPGHRTDECHATHGLNTPAARELFRLVKLALAERLNQGDGHLDCIRGRK